MINLVSDTVTKPTREMRQAMFQAEVGDDVFREDPTVNKLEEYAASLFNMEAALFCPSGTMTNQIALKAHTNALDEVICDKTSHIYQYETAGYAYHSRLGVQLLDGHFGKINAEMIQDAVRPNQDWLPNSKLVVIENSCNKGGGSFYTLDEIGTISEVCKRNHLVLHMDGARVFNVFAEVDYSPSDLAPYLDSISICTSKGLGAPVGSLLLGKTPFIAKSRKLRKLFGGGMRQAGIIAAGSLYALENHITRLKEDNDRAKELGAILTKQSYVDTVNPVKTNIVIFTLKNVSTEDFLLELEKNHIKAIALDKKTMRFVTHLDYTAEMHQRVLESLVDIQF